MIRFQQVARLPSVDKATAFKTSLRNRGAFEIDPFLDWSEFARDKTVTKDNIDEILGHPNQDKLVVLKVRPETNSRTQIFVFWLRVWIHPSFLTAPFRQVFQHEVEDTENGGMVTANGMVFTSPRLLKGMKCAIRDTKNQVHGSRDQRPT